MYIITCIDDSGTERLNQVVCRTKKTAERIMKKLLLEDKVRLNKQCGMNESDVEKLTQYEIEKIEYISK